MSFPYAVEMQQLSARGYTLARDLPSALEAFEDARTLIQQLDEPCDVRLFAGSFSFDDAGFVVCLGEYTELAFGSN